MNTPRLSNVLLILLMCVLSAFGEEAQVTWNDMCPCSFADDPEEGKLLQKRIHSWDHGLEPQLCWKGGEPCREPNEVLTKEIAFARKIMADVLKPEFVPANVPNEKFLLVRDLDFVNGKEDALVVRFLKEKYMVKFMKTKMRITITVRPVSAKTLGVRQTAEEIFNKKLLPPTWEERWYMPHMKREGEWMRTGWWLPQDGWTVDSEGCRTPTSKPSPSILHPVGIGVYRYARFCTNSKFIGYELVGGPPRRRNKGGEGKEPDK
jgi:hypothetical protein